MIIIKSSREIALMREAGKIVAKVFDELKQFIGTPYTMVIRAGNLVEGISGSLTEAHLENIVKDYKLDRVK